MPSVKHGDTTDVTWTVNANLTGADVRVIARSQTDRVVYELPLGAITNGATSTVVTPLDGTLPIATYDVELEITIGGEISTAPTVGYACLKVTADLG